MRYLWLGIRRHLKVPDGCLEVVILERCLGSLEVLQGAQDLQEMFHYLM